MALIYLSAGHGGKDPGASGNGYVEKALNLEVTDVVAKHMKSAGHNVIRNRVNDSDSKIADKTASANAAKVDLFVEVHFNAFNASARGTEVYYSVLGGIGKNLAKEIHDEITKLGFVARGIKTKVNSAGSDYFGIIRGTKAPAVLVECAFIDNKGDMDIYKSSGGASAMGKAIADGILKVFPAIPKPVPAPAPSPTPSGGVFAIGSKVVANKALLHKNASGGSPGSTVSGEYFITRYLKGSKYPYNIGKNPTETLGWVKESALSAKADPKPTPAPAPASSQKFATGSQIRVTNAILHKDSDGNSPGKKVSGNFIVTQYAKGKKFAYNLGTKASDRLGWISEASISKPSVAATPTKSSFSKGDMVVSVNNVVYGTAENANKGQRGVSLNSAYKGVALKVNGTYHNNMVARVINSSGKAVGFFKFKDVKFK